jgi:type VI secretion system protein ImpE
VSWVIQAAKMSAAGQHDAASELRARAFDAAPAVAGSMAVGDDPTPRPFEWIADADERLGPMLEAIVDGKYYWIPWQRIALVKIDKPADLRDTVWLPANFVWSAGGSSVGLIPVRYPGSENAANDPLIRMARKTDFVEQAGAQVPLGQRLLATDAAEFPLLEVRSVRVGDAPLNPDALTDAANTAAMALSSALKPGGGNG